MKGLKLEYDFKYCPACGGPITTPVHMSLVLSEPENGFGSEEIDLSDCDYPDGCVRLLCDACYESSGRMVS
ncbi:hypothetical protein [Oryzomonas rubra]|uniref:Uncharacterized protein n=1 Tax=Oryzomonas rubra TaxID=2509454 RepID=A0A5A9XPU5_9BACT|nr:hypothetical protein [Oryzomonas rubra]KAA0895182.1 hypothetical protein ET418_01285 [Oryzomonas rubra]